MTTTSGEPLPDDLFETGALLEEGTTEEDALIGAPEDEVESEGGED